MVDRVSWVRFPWPQYGLYLSVGSRSARRLDRGMRLFMALSLLGIFCFPRLHLAADAKLRLEDLTWVFVLLLVAANVIKRTLVLTKVLLFPLLYFAYALLISLIRALAEGSGFEFVLFFGKEFQYYIFFLASYYLVIRGRANTILSVALFLAAVNVTWGIYQIATGRVAYYGIGAMFLDESPSLSGLVYLSGVMVAAFVLHFGLTNVVTIGLPGTRLRRLCVYFLMWASAICALATGSRTSGFGAVAFLALLLLGRSILLVNTWDRLLWNKAKLILVAVTCAILLNVLISEWGYQIGEYIDLRRYVNPIESIGARAEENWSVNIERSQSLMDYLVGLGYSAGHTVLGEDRVVFGMGYDSQYMRNFLVLGILGSILWVAMLIRFGTALRGSRQALVFFFAVIGSYLFMGIAIEVFQLSKSGAMVWIILGMLVGMRKREMRTVAVPSGCWPPSISPLRTAIQRGEAWRL